MANLFSFIEEGRFSVDEFQFFIEALLKGLSKCLLTKSKRPRLLLFILVLTIRVDHKEIEKFSRLIFKGNSSLPTSTFVESIPEINSETFFSALNLVPS